MKQLSAYVLEAYDNSSELDEEFNTAYEELLSTCDSEELKESRIAIKESIRAKFKAKMHSASQSVKRHAGSAKDKAKSFVHSMWHDDHV